MMNKMIYFPKILFVLFCFYISNFSFAQDASRAQDQLSAQQLRALQANQSNQSGQENQSPDIDNFLQRPSQQLSPAQIRSGNTDTLPFGHNLFSNGIESSRESGINPSYLVAPGDKISVQLWGTVTFSSVLTVDTQGNIFVPNVGPIAVGNVPASQLNSKVSGEIRKTYTKNVNIYINLLTATPVGVFVTGGVVQPGQYAGLASDSILHFLKRAGGIDSLRGSYRKISILRENLEVKSFDLYDFLRFGRLDSFSFQDSDVLLVSEQGDIVTVEGAAKNPFIFEFLENENNGEQILRYALPFVETSHVGVTGIRKGKPVSVYLSMDDFKSFEMGNGDKLLFNDDIRPQVLSVSVSGSYLGPSFYAIKPEVRLHDLLAQIEVDLDQAAIQSIYIKRRSVVERQTELLDESIRRLERSIYTAPASSEGEARIRLQEAELIAQFIERAKDVEPIGKVVVSRKDEVANIRLEDGDEIVIPYQTDLIQVSGEVLIPQAVVFDEGMLLSDYISSVGGFTERADDKQVAIIHANGLVSFLDVNTSSYWFNNSSEVALQPGDQILALPKVDNKILQAVKDITQIIFQIAVAANVAVD